MQKQLSGGHHEDHDQDQYVPKHIMLGIDGTWQAAFSDLFQSNVFRMNTALNYDDGTSHRNPQIYIYVAGVGTAMKTGRLRAGILGEGLDELILQAYINLVSNCGPRDKIYLFGFSRGAVAARALTGLISTAGLLKPDSAPMIEEAWTFFTNRGQGTDYLSKKAANTHSDVSIEFLGVWDTVSGPYKQAELFERYRFGGLRLDPVVKTGVHVIAMDETRKDFVPVLWTGKSQNRPDQNLEQIWMPGVHCDIGGGYRRSLLSTVSLLCMVDRLTHYCPEVGIDEDYIADTLRGILQVEDITVNDEWAEYYLQMFRSTQRQVPAAPAGSHTRHPLATLMSGKEVAFKGARKSYAPLCRPAVPDQEATFEPESYYATMAKAILEGKLA